MKTFYVMQDNSLEEYLSQDSSNSGSPGNPGSGGNGCESVCANANPNSAAYSMCGCGGGEPAAPISSQFSIGIGLTIGVLMAIIYFSSQNKYLMSWYRTKDFFWIRSALIVVIIVTFVVLGALNS